MSLREQRAAATLGDPRWAKVVDRDPTADGKFVYSVRTTKIYCRPSCTSRAAKPENVDFYATPQEAELRGFRPCKRCKPDQLSPAIQQADKIAEICRVIETAEHMPALKQLAEHANISVYHFHRIFKSVTGLTPKAYAKAHRQLRVRQELENRDTVTEAIFGAGYNSTGRFYEESDNVLGMTPSEYRSGGANTEIRFAIGECSLGSILVAQSARGICAILIGNDPQTLAYDLQDKFPSAHIIGGDAEFEKLVAVVVGMVEDPALGINLPLDIRGTAFQQRVWHALQQIPPGETISYSELAQRIGAPKAARAVASACAHNILAVAIPCHRVVHQDGSISGYRWGVERKRALLKRESKN